MDGSKLKLKVVTPSNVLIETECDAVYSTGANGMFGVLLNHAPMMCPLAIGITKYVNDGKEFYLTTLGGIFQIDSNVVTILSDNAELGSDIDVQRAEAAKAKAESVLFSSDAARDDVLKAELKLAKALARLKAALHS